MFLKRQEVIKRSALRVVLSTLLLFSPAFSAGAQEHVLRVISANGLEFLIPERVAGTFAHGIVHHVFETLTRITPEGKLEGLLAKSWEPAKDGKGWIFHLRPGVKFSDGTPFNAEAVAFDIKHLIDTQNLVPARANLGTINGATAIDDLTVEITSSRPFSGMPIWLSHAVAGMVSPESYKKWGNDVGTHAAAGTGPMMYGEFQIPDHVVLVKNPSYWGTPAKIDKIDIKAVVDDQTRLAALLSGEADIDFYLDVEDIPRIEGSGDFKVGSVPSIREYLVHLPMQMPEMQDKRVRQALNHAIDRATIVKQIFQGQAAPGDAAIGPGVVGYKPIGVIPFDPKKAADLFAEAGWKKDGKGILTRDGKPFPTLRLQATTGRYPSDAALAQAISGYLTAAGVPNQPAISEFATFMADARAKARSDKWLVQIPWGFPTGDGASMLCQVYMPANVFDFGGYDSPNLAKACETINSTFDMDKRTPVIEQAAAAVYDDAPAIFVAYPSYVVAMRKNLEGVRLSAFEFHDMSQAVLK